MSARMKLTGNAGHDAQLRHRADGLAVLSFNFANPYQRREARGGQVEVTDWYQVVVFGPRAEQLAGKIRKGAFLEINGSPKLESFIDREGNPRRRCVIDAADIRFLRQAEDPAAGITADCDAELCPVS